MGHIGLDFGGELTWQPDYPGEDPPNADELQRDPTLQSSWSIYGGNENPNDVPRDDAGNRLDWSPSVPQDGFFSSIAGHIDKAQEWTQNELSSAYDWAKGEEQKVVDIFNAETKKIGDSLTDLATAPANVAAGLGRGVAAVGTLALVGAILGGLWLLNNHKTVAKHVVKAAKKSGKVAKSAAKIAAVVA